MYLTPLRELLFKVLFILLVWVGTSVGMLFPDSYMLIFCISSNTSLILLSNICFPLATQVIWHYLGFVMSLLDRSSFAKMSETTGQKQLDTVSFVLSRTYVAHVLIWGLREMKMWVNYDTEFK